MAASAVPACPCGSNHRLTNCFKCVQVAAVPDPIESLPKEVEASTPTQTGEYMLALSARLASIGMRESDDDAALLLPPLPRR